MDYRPIIESSYNRSSWQTLLHDIFRQRVEFVANPIPVTATTTIARQAYYLGKVTLSDGETLNIYEVQLTEQVELMRNRVGIRNLLLNDWRAQGCAGAFLFCYRPGESMLRFSYVSEAWRFGENAQYEEQKTDTRRFTYLLGEGRRCRTAIAEFEKLAQSKQALEDVTKVFNIEAVSDAFFRGYKERYEDIIEYITGKRMVKRGNKWEETVTGLPCQAILDEFARFDDPEKSVRDYVKKLMGRLVFLQFLQKKGWMGVPAGLAWTGGDPEFLQNLFARSNRKDTFIDDVLEPLFNDLNTKRTSDLVTSPTVNFGRAIKVPYLNGGLFEMDEADQTTFTLPARFIENLLTFFSYYNFTIDENDPDDAEIGVDPEMLGRIFENLLEDNKDKGAFYTPKEIVQYMCRESLIAYLTTYSIEHGNKNPREAVEKALRDMVNTPDVIVPRMKPEQKENFGNALRDVKICDPAIGSGAFPMGLLNELVRCRVSISAWAKDKDGRLLVDDYAALKREIISNNIYGVDIERGAIDIARLRFWLSIVVDEKIPHTLPNLDYKFMQGNSLITTFDGEYVNLDTKEQKHVNVNDMITEKITLHALKQQYYKATGEEKYKLGIQIKDTILRLVSRQIGFEMRSWVQKNATEQTLAFDDAATASFQTIKRALPADKLRIINLAESLHKRLNDPTISLAERAFTDIHFFDWRIMFTEVFEGKKPGFDIVIGNPPYIPLQDNDGALSQLYEHKGFETLNYCGDIYCLFYEHAYNILRQGGISCYITSCQWLMASYGKELRQFLSQKTNPIFLIDFTGVKIFDDATVDTNILMFIKSKNLASTKSIRMKGQSKSILDSLSSYVQNNQCICNFTTSSEWIIQSDKDFLIKEKMRKFIPLKKLDIAINYGIKAGYNDAFIITEDKRNEILQGCVNKEEYDRTVEIIQPVLRGRDVHKWYFNHAGLYLIAFLPSRKYNISDYPSVEKHLLSFGVERLEQTGKKYVIDGKEIKARKKTNNKWFETQDSIAYWKRFYEPKLIYPETTVRRSEFCYDESGILLDKTNFFISGKDLMYIHGILTSTLMEWFLEKELRQLGKRTIQYSKQWMENIPIAFSREKKKITELVALIHEAKNKDTNANISSLEAEINRLVYQLYGLTNAEVKIIDPNETTTGADDDLFKA